MWVWVSTLPAGSLNAGALVSGSGPATAGIGLVGSSAANAAPLTRPVAAPAVAIRNSRRFMSFLPIVIGGLGVAPPRVRGILWRGCTVRHAVVPVDVGRLQRGHRGRHQLLDGLRGV